VLPGKKTRKGHAAEVTITMTPVLSDELLPTTFRNLVGERPRGADRVPLTQVLNDREFVKDYMTEDVYDVARVLDKQELQPNAAKNHRIRKALSGSQTTHSPDARSR